MGFEHAIALWDDASVGHDEVQGRHLLRFKHGGAHGGGVRHVGIDLVHVCAELAALRGGRAEIGGVAKGQQHKAHARRGQALREPAPNSRGRTRHEHMFEGRWRPPPLLQLRAALAMEDGSSQKPVRRNAQHQHQQRERVARETRNQLRHRLANKLHL